MCLSLYFDYNVIEMVPLNSFNFVVIVVMVIGLISAYIASAIISYLHFNVVLFMCPKK